jgi:hypothetical protein
MVCAIILMQRNSGHPCEYVNQQLVREGRIWNYLVCGENCGYGKELLGADFSVPAQSTAVIRPHSIE